MPTLGAAAAVAYRGKVLLIKRRDVEIWALPGGAVENGESLAQAAVREVREETGVSVELTRLVGVYSRPNWRAGGDHGVLFAARPLSHDIVPQPEEALEAAYFAPDALPEPHAWWIKERINDALEGKTGVARLQDALWPAGTGTDWRRRMADSPLSPSAFYAEHFSKIGPLGDRVETPGA